MGVRGGGTRRGGRGGKEEEGRATTVWVSDADEGELGTMLTVLSGGTTARGRKRGGSKESKSVSYVYRGDTMTRWARAEKK